MTCIVGLIKGRTVWLGADSASTDTQFHKTIIKDPKVFVRGRIGLGVCGYPKVMDALSSGIDMPEQSCNDDRAFLVNELVPTIRDGLVRLDAAFRDEKTSEIVFNGEALLAYNGKLYKLQSNFQLIQARAGFDTTGSGGDLAMGSMASTAHVRNPKKRILMALEAASANNAGCAPPYVIVSVKK